MCGSGRIGRSGTVRRMHLDHRSPACKARLGEVVTCEVGGAAQVEGAVALSVVVRSGPIMTAVNGTVVAQPPEYNLGKACHCWVHLPP
jgi:hypothetical protein